MDTQFIYCPKCSTRNFADDKVCGVCKTKLSGTVTNHATQKVTTEQPTNWKALFIIIGAIIIFYFAFIRDNGTSSNNYSSGSSSSDSYSESSQLSEYYINQESFSTMNKSDFDEMYDYVVNNDMQALRTMVTDGRIVVLAKGTEISIVDVHFSYNIIRVKGYTQKLWIAIERVSIHK